MRNSLDHHENTSIIRIIFVLFSSTVRFNSLTNFLTTLFSVCVISSGLNSCPLGTYLFSPLWFCSFPTEVISKTSSLGSLSTNEKVLFCFVFNIWWWSEKWKCIVMRSTLLQVQSLLDTHLTMSPLCNVDRFWETKTLQGWSGERKWGEKVFMDWDILGHIEHQPKGVWTIACPFHNLGNARVCRAQCWGISAFGTLMSQSVSQDGGTFQQVRIYPGIVFEY